jgi:hypothetical protein
MGPQPATVLVPPAATAPIPGIADHLVSVPAYLTSPSAVLGQLAEHAIGTNPWEHAARHFAGNWEAVAAGASALEHLAEFNDAFASAVGERIAATVPGHWEGRAAQSAAEYFTGLTETLHAQAREIRGLAREFDQLAAGVQLDVDAVSGLLELITDLLLTAAVSAAAIYVMPLSAVLTVAVFAQAFQHWRTVLGIVDTTWSVAQAFIAYVTEATAVLDATGDHPLPPAAYNHPGA